MRLAAIDLGTNTSLMLVADYVPATPHKGRLIRVGDFLEVPRLGEGLDKTQTLSDAAMERTLTTLTRHQQRAAALGVQKLLVVATEAVRAARNGPAFIQRVQQLGLSLDVLTGTQEAYLSFRSVSGLTLPKGPHSVLDIGGGSTELIVGVGRQVTASHSVPIGSVRLTERYLAGDPPSASQVQALIEAIDAALVALPAVEGPLVAVAGTATTLAALHLGLAKYNGEAVDGLVLSVAALQALCQRLGELPVAKRRELPGLDPRRADVIYAGAMILLRVAQRAGEHPIIISDRGVRWGVLEDLTEKLPPADDRE